MIYLTKGQQLADNPSMVIYDPTGYYNDGDSIICASAATPDEPAVRYEAKFVAYGGMVYSISDPDELLAEIIKLDPKSLFGKDSQQVAVDKVVADIVPQAEGVVPADGAEVVEDIPVDDQTATTTPPVIPPPTTTSTTTPAVSTTTPSTTATSTPSTDTGTSTTTPNFDFSSGDTSTTTPSFNLSTTTPETSTSSGTGVATTTPPDILFPDTGTSTTTPQVEASSTPSVVQPDTNTSTTSPSIIPTILDTPSETSTTSEVVAFAKKLVKKRISKKLGL
jgi:hypothetical protein